MLEQAPETTPPGQSVVSFAITLAILLGGLVFLGYGSFEYGFWRNRGPGAGFFPVLFGAGAALLAAIELFRAQRQTDRARAANFLPALAAGAAILAVPLLGMILAMSVFVLLWLRLVEKESWARSLILGIGTGVVVHLLFSVWLGVVFPTALLFGWI